jgi:hypothetical protein
MTMVVGVAGVACFEEEDEPSDASPPSRCRRMESGVFAPYGAGDDVNREKVFCIDVGAGATHMEWKTVGNSDVALFTSRGQQPEPTFSDSEQKWSGVYDQMDDSEAHAPSSAGVSAYVVIKSPNINTQITTGRYYAVVTGRSSFAAGEIEAKIYCNALDKLGLPYPVAFVDGKCPVGAPVDAGPAEPGGAIASCTDEAKHVCSEILTGDAAAYSAQCTKNGQKGALGPCDASYKTGPNCMNASFTSVGKPVTGNFWWKSDYCALTNNSIDTHGTCCDLKGTPSAFKQCRGDTMPQLNSGTCP